MKINDSSLLNSSYVYNKDANNEDQQALNKQQEQEQVVSGFKAPKDFLNFMSTFDDLAKAVVNKDVQEQDRLQLELNKQLGNSDAYSLNVQYLKDNAQSFIHAQQTKDIAQIQYAALLN